MVTASMERRQQKSLRATKPQLEKRPLRVSNAMSTPKRMRIAEKQPKCSVGPLDRYVVRTPPGGTPAAVKSPENEKLPKCSVGPLDRYVVRTPPSGTPSAVKSPENAHRDPNILNQPIVRIKKVELCPGNPCGKVELQAVALPPLPVPAAKRRLFEPNDVKGESKRPADDRTGDGVKTKKNTIKIPGPVIARAFSKFATFMSSQQSVGRFDTFIHFSNVTATNAEIEQLAKPLPSTLTAICRNYWEVGMNSDLINFLNSCVNVGSYPQWQTLAIVLWKVLMEETWDATLRGAYCLLRSVLWLHPPASDQMQLYYHNVLCFCMDSQTLDYGGGQKRLLDTLDFSRFQRNDSVEKRSSVGLLRENRIWVLKYLASLFETDFMLFSKRNSTPCNAVPLLALLLWPNKRVDYVSKTVQDLVQLIVSSLTSADVEPDAQHCCLRLLAVAAECCYWADGMVGGKNTDVLLVPKIGLVASSFAMHVSREIAAQQLTYQSLHDLLSKISPSWLCLHVCQYLLERTGSVEKSIGDPSNQSLTLKILCTDYFASIFGFHPSGSLVTQVSENKLTVSVSSAKLPVVSKENMPKELQPPLNKVFHEPNLCSPVRSAPNTSSPNRGKAVKSKRNLNPETVNKCNFKGETALHRACMKNDAAKVSQLLSIPGILVNATDNAGWTPLHEACCYGSTECVKQLLSYRPQDNIQQYFSPGKEKKIMVNVDALGLDGITPVLDAIRNGHHAIVQLLLRHSGATLLKAVTSEGRTAFDLAEDDQMRVLLERYRSNKGETAAAACSTSSQISTASESDLESLVALPRCSSLESSPLRVNFILLYHAIVSYLNFHQTSHLWKIINEEMASTEFLSDNCESLFCGFDAAVANHLADDLSQLYKLKRRLGKVRNCFAVGEGESDTIHLLLDNLASLSISNVTSYDKMK